MILASNERNFFLKKQKAVVWFALARSAKKSKSDSLL